jgi:hypothetical protein
MDERKGQEGLLLLLPMVNFFAEYHKKIESQKDILQVFFLKRMKELCDEAPNDQANCH